MLLLIVFISSFGAATILPLFSEVSVVAAYEQGENAFLIWVVASIGNVLGALVNYVLGRYLRRFQSRSWFPIKADNINTATLWFQRYGVWSLLLSWLPIVGDALTFIAGTAKTRVSLFLLLVFIGKSLRYAVLIFTLMQIL